jgi:hypothetical protein
MATDLRVIMDDSPGGLADLGEALGAAGINIEGLCGVTHQGTGIIHVLVDDAAAARSALEGAGLSVEGHTDVIVGELPENVDKPGTLGAMARKVADAGVNVTVAYLATKNRVVIGTSDNAKAKDALAI